LFAQATESGEQTVAAAVVDIEDLVAGRVCDRDVDADAREAVALVRQAL
jgi:hypothetical protein